MVTPGIRGGTAINASMPRPYLMLVIGESSLSLTMRAGVALSLFDNDALSSCCEFTADVGFIDVFIVGLTLQS